MCSPVSVLPGVSAPCGLIGPAEKGLLGVKYRAKSSGDHASAPKPHTQVGFLSEICCKVERHLFKAHLTKPVAFTQMERSDASNVIPPEASMVSNIRLNPEDTIDSAIVYLRETAGNPDVEITKIRGMNPSPISEANRPAWNKVAGAVASTWKGCLVSPYLMVQC